jgi:hypothetical protein
MARVSEVAANLRGRWMAMARGQRKWLGASALLVAGVCAAMFWYAGKTDWRVLYSGLEGKDVQQIAQELSAAGISYEVTEDGGGVKVASDMVDKARMEVAVKGMPQSGRMGFELFDKPNWVGSEFDEKVNQNIVMPGSAASTQTVSAGLQIGLGTRAAATEVIMTQGDFNQTGNTLDLAIQGSGFFQVTQPDGTTAYTRAGSFHLNNQGTMVTMDGNALIPAITIPSNATGVTISNYGVVTATLPGQATGTQLGTIQLATFANPGGLNSVGSNLFCLPDHPAMP